MKKGLLDSLLDIKGPQLLEEVDALVALCHQQCYVLVQVHLVVQDGSQVLVLGDDLYLLVFNQQGDMGGRASPFCFAEVQKEEILITPLDLGADSFLVGCLIITQHFLEDTVSSENLIWRNLNQHWQLAE